MSSDSLAVFRKNLGPDLRKLADDHLKHDLKEEDRVALKRAGGTVGTHTTIGSLVGLGLGLFLAFRIRANRGALYKNFKAHEQPTALKFASGREEALPDLSNIMRPSTLGDIATYTFLGFGGLFLGGETGLLTGSWRARSKINRDPEMKQRIETAFRKFQADAMRAQANLLDSNDGRGKSII